MKNRIITIATCLLLVAATAWATTLTLTLDSSQPIKEQAEQLQDYIKSQPKEARQEWYMYLSIIIDGVDRSLPSRQGIKTPVYVAITSGKRFHANSSCSALKQAAEVIKMDKAEALERGFKPCNVCGK